MGQHQAVNGVNLFRYQDCREGAGCRLSSPQPAGIIDKAVTVRGSDNDATAVAHRCQHHTHTGGRGRWERSNNQSEPDPAKQCQGILPARPPRERLQAEPAGSSGRIAHLANGTRCRPAEKQRRHQQIPPSQPPARRCGHPPTPARHHRCGRHDAVETPQGEATQTPRQPAHSRKQPAEQQAAEAGSHRHRHHRGKQQVHPNRNRGQPLKRVRDKRGCRQPNCQTRNRKTATTSGQTADLPEKWRAAFLKQTLNWIDRRLRHQPGCHDQQDCGCQKRQLGSNRNRGRGAPDQKHNCR